ncbi:PIN domain-containing protein [Candidatus Bathyarchaeota archaeon]|nr:PIN domain-containing protein [Candidatus Bathyarchaeota archaeon]
MIIDTTYLLPLARIKIDKDLLRAIADEKVKLSFEDIRINTISMFELQAKAAKLTIPAKFIIEATETILKAFKIEQFYKPEIIEIANEIRKSIPDYIDCIILATAILTKENLITEDSLILSKRERIQREYGIKILTFSELTER